MIDLVKSTKKGLSRLILISAQSTPINYCVLELLDLFRCEIEERGVNLVTFEMRGGNNFRKTYLRGVLKELNARLRGGVNFLTPCTPTSISSKDDLR